MKKILKLVAMTLLAVVLTACSGNKSTTNTNAETSTSETTTSAVAAVTETYKMTQSVDGGSQDIYFIVTYREEEYEALEIRYETKFSADIAELLKAQGREAVEQNFNDNLDAMIPGTNLFKEMDGVDVVSTVDDQFVWHLTIKMDPKVVNFEELSATSFSFLADIKDTSPKQLLAGLNLVGFQKVSE
ncbi:hypothetical protein [Streptococcus plurextorum]|uniref:hypothetical protein n=1 Tax=Streptococcus plurextorum TaxID=456876 RepID=UPI0004034B33|nr:hypothetical protein [Streptococcus plurextorum]